MTSSPSSWNNAAVLKVTVIAALGGLLFGYDTGVIAGAQLYFTKYFELSAAQQGWAVGSALYGCLFGAIMAGYLTKAISRKYTLLLSAVLFCLSAWGSGVSMSLNELVLYRIIGGVGIGLASMAAPMYIAEVSPAAIRGRMVSLYQLAVVVGFFVVFLATYYIGGDTSGELSVSAQTELHKYNVSQGWRVMFWSELAPAGLFFVLLFFMPHSPRWLAIKHRYNAAKDQLEDLGLTEYEAEAELKEIKRSLAVPEAGFKQLMTKAIAFAVFVGVMLSIFQQITGINAILYYGAEIFSSALGYGPEDALKQQLWLGAVNLAFTFVAIFTIDKWGRKPLFIMGSLGMSLGLLVLGLTIATGKIGVLSLVAVLVFIGSFAMSMGPVVWVMLSEMFPNTVRSVAMSIAVAAQWLFNGIVANTFPLVNQSDLNADVFNGGLPYFIFAAFCVVACVFVWRLVPETKGQSLEALEQLWDKKS